jgi:class 3 adenylate cyclase/lipopolysaccharide biosynthesis regulator YciM
MKKILFTLSIVVSSLAGQAQTNLDSLRGVWKDESQNDTNRLAAMRLIVIEKFLDTTPDSAIYYGEKMQTLAESAASSHWQVVALHLQGLGYYDKRTENGSEPVEVFSEALGLYKNAREEEWKEIGNAERTALQYDLIGRAYHKQAKFGQAIEVHYKALKISEEQLDTIGIARSLHDIGHVHHIQEDLTKALEFYSRSLALNRLINNPKPMHIDLNNMANIYSEQNEYDLALEYHAEALTIGKKLNSPNLIAWSMSNLAWVYYSLPQYDQALTNFMEAIETLADSSHQINLTSLMGAGQVYAAQGDYQKAIEFHQQSFELAKGQNWTRGMNFASFYLYNAYKALGQTGKSLEMYELHIQLNDSMNSEENKRAIISQEYQYTYEKQTLADSLEFAKKEAIKDIELEQQAKDISNQWLALGFGGFALFLIFGLAVFVYKGKKRSDELLLNILPEEVAKELKEKGHADAQLINHVTVLFTDFKGFTALSEQVTPKDLVADLHTYFSEFDRICEKYDIEKIKTIGDAYMAAGGLPTPNQTHPTDVVKAALEMAEIVEKGKAKKIAENLPFFEVRAGVHTGPVVAGIVGVKKFQYDIWGDTVNTASRMETSGEVGKVNISQATYELLKDDSIFTFESRGKIEAKGKGEIEMYFVSKT